MKLIVLLFFFLLTDYVHSACSTPVSRGGTFSSGTTISSSAMNTQLNTLYTHVNNIDGDCIQDTSLNKSKLEAGYKDKTITSITGTYTALSTDEVILASAGSAFTITLPTAVGITGRTYTIKKTDASVNAVTLDANGAETIDGALTISLANQYESVTLVSNGVSWIIEEFKPFIITTPGLAKAVEYSARISSTGVVSNEKGEWITGNAAVASAVYTLTTSAFGSNPNCTVQLNQAGVTVRLVNFDATNSTSTSLIYRIFDVSNNPQAFDATITCHGSQP